MSLAEAAAQSRLSAAVEIVAAAGDLARHHFLNRAALVQEVKGLQDYVSIADRAVEDLIRERLAARFPGESVLGEEAGESLPGARVVWVVDPIDGTHNFLRGIAYFCVSLACVIDGVLEIGIVYDPMAGEMFAGRRGGGATCNGLPLRCGTARGPREALLGLGQSTRCPNDPYAALVGLALNGGAAFRQLGAGALMLAHAAAGRLDGYYEAHHNSWDALGGLLLNRESGAWTNDFLADDGIHRGNTILVCAPALRQPLGAMLTAAGLPDPV